MLSPAPRSTAAPAAPSAPPIASGQRGPIRATRRPAGMPASAKRSGCGQERQARLERGQATDVLEVQRHQEELPVDGEVDQRPRGGRRGERAGGEQGQRKHRSAATALDGDEGDPATTARAMPPSDQRRAPPERATRDEREGQRGERDDGRRLSGEIEPAGRAGGLGDAAPQQERDRGGEGQVDREDEPPADRVDEEAAEHGAGRERRRRDRRPDPDGAGAPDRVRVRVGQQGQRRRHERGGADPEQDLGGDERRRCSGRARPRRTPRRRSPRPRASSGAPRGGRRERRRSAAAPRARACSR